MLKSINDLRLKAKAYLNSEVTAPTYALFITWGVAFIVGYLVA